MCWIFPAPVPSSKWSGVPFCMYGKDDCAPIEHAASARGANAANGKAKKRFIGSHYAARGAASFRSLTSRRCVSKRSRGDMTSSCRNARSRGRAQPPAQPISRVRRRTFETRREFAAMSEHKAAVRQPVHRSKRCARRERVGSVGESAPLRDANGCTIENPLAKILVRRHLSGSELVSEHCAEDLQGNTTVDEARSRLVPQRRSERAIVGRNACAKAAETKTRRQREQHAKRNAPFPRILSPRRDRFGDRFVEREHLVGAGVEREHAPKALRPAVERVGRVGSEAGAILLEQQIAARDHERVQGVLTRVLERGRRVEGMLHWRSVRSLLAKAPSCGRTFCWLPRSPRSGACSSATIPASSLARFSSLPRTSLSIRGCRPLRSASF